jgi:hypothetical protein
LIKGYAIGCVGMEIKAVRKQHPRKGNLPSLVSCDELALEIK